MATLRAQALCRSPGRDRGSRTAWPQSKEHLRGNDICTKGRWQPAEMGKEVFLASMLALSLTSVSLILMLFVSPA